MVVQTLSTGVTMALYSNNICNVATFLLLPSNKDIWWIENKTGNYLTHTHGKTICQGQKSRTILNDKSQFSKSI